MNSNLLPPLPGETLGYGYPDWPEDLTTFAERKAYQRGVADARAVLLAHQAEREPLTDEQIDAMLASTERGVSMKFTLRNFARNVEQAHGVQPAQQAEPEDMPGRIPKPHPWPPAPPIQGPASLATTKADDYKAWYEEAMVASNEAGYVGLDAAQTIRALAALVSEDCRAVCEAALVAHGVFFAIGQRVRPDSPALEAIWKAVDAMLAARPAPNATPPPNSIA